MPRLHANQRSEAFGMLCGGTSASAIARYFNCHPSTITRLANRFQETGIVKDRQRPGQPIITTRRQYGTMRMLHRRNRFRSASVTAKTIVGRRGRPIHPGTVRCRLRTAVLKCRRPFRGSIHTGRHRKARIRWARTYLRFHNTDCQILSHPRCLACIASESSHTRFLFVKWKHTTSWN